MPVGKPLPPQSGRLFRFRSVGPGVFQSLPGVIPRREIPFRGSGVPEGGGKLGPPGQRSASKTKVLLGTASSQKALNTLKIATFRALGGRKRREIG